MEYRSGAGVHTVHIVADDTVVTVEETYLADADPASAGESVVEVVLETPAAAIAEVDRRAQERLRLRWPEVDATTPRGLPTPALARVAREPALEALCRAAPADDATPWAVYADWLQQHGDPVGEIAALRQRGHDDEALAHMYRRDARIWGHHAPNVQRQPWELEWRHGFLRALILGARPRVELDVDAEVVLALPIARFVDELSVGGPNEGDWAPVMAAITRAAQAPHLRVVKLDFSQREDTPVGDLAFAWPHLPALRHLAIHSTAAATLGVIDLPELRVYERISGGLSRRDLDAVHAARWPRLESLELWIGARESGAAITADDLERIARGDGTPNLRHVGIVKCELADAAIAILAESRLLPRLRTLDLSRGTLGDAGVAALVEHADRFAHLDAIDLSDNIFDDDDLARLRAILPNVLDPGGGPAPRSSHGDSDR